MVKVFCGNPNSSGYRLTTADRGKWREPGEFCQSQLAPERQVTKEVDESTNLSLTSYHKRGWKTLNSFTTDLGSVDLIGTHYDNS